MAKDIRVGVEQGGGPTLGYRWTVLILDTAYRDARRFLTEDQCQHLAWPFQELAREEDPTHSVTASVDQIEDFYELRDKGGILGSLNVRVFFSLDRGRSALVVLGAVKKQNDGPTPKGDKVRMRRRKRLYDSGQLREG
jgi:hypothetical protein